MNDRIFNILNQIKDSISSKNETEQVLASYEYRCPKCGLVLEFNRNQSSVKCPNDNNTMFRI